MITTVALSAAVLALALRPAWLFPETVPANHKNPRQQWQEVGFNFDSLQPGDLVVRAGRSFFSDQLRRYNAKDQTYSHCALVTRSVSGAPLLFHSIGGSDNPDQVIRCDSLYTFLNAEEALGFAIFRYRLPAVQVARIDSVARQFFAERRMFDMKFDLADDDRLYCAEFVYKVILEATHDPRIISLSRQGEKVYVGVDDLYFNNLTQKLFEHEYN
jgi:hypothetical protein